MIASPIQYLSVFSRPPSIRKALQAARQAQSRWAALPLEERLARVRAFRRLLAERAGSLAETVDLPERSLTAETLSAEILPLADACRFLERYAQSILRSTTSGGIRSLLPGGLAVKIERAPWGLVLVICAGNYPIFLPGAQAIQALAAGNAVLLKPAPGTGRVVGALAEMLVQAGVPPSLLVTLDETPETAQKVMAAGVDKVLFTGSSETGRTVLSQLAQTLTPATMELSGCDSVFVHREADLQNVVEALRFGLTFNQSATCIAPRRVFVPEERAEELERLLAALIAETDPIQLSPERARMLRSLVREAIEQGARLVGSGMESDESTTPIVLADVRPEMDVASTDIFAPLVSILSCKDFGNALEMDRQCPYSLGASVFGPPKAATSWAARIEAGVIVLNDMIAPTADPRVPFGGRGESGYGITRGGEGLLELTRPRTVLQRQGHWRPHFQTLKQGDERLFEGLIRARHGRSWRLRIRGYFQLVSAVRKMAKQASEI